MSEVRRKDATMPCGKCGAAMVVVRVWPLPDDQDLEIHMFKCEICAATEFFRFKKPRSNIGQQSPARGQV
jgi:hypothetical protein